MSDFGKDINVPNKDIVYRQDVEDMLQNALPSRGMWEIEGDAVKNAICETVADLMMDLGKLPSAQAELCEYYALCRHGRDENKLRSALRCCDYCTEDSDGYVKPIEKNSHAFIRFGMDGWELDLRAKGWHGSTKIMYCPMCGRRLERG